MQGQEIRRVMVGCRQGPGVYGTTGHGYPIPLCMECVSSDGVALEIGNLAVKQGIGGHRQGPGVYGTTGQ